MDSGRTARGRVLLVVKLAFVALALAAGVVYVARYRAEVSAALADLGLPVLAASTVLALLALLAALLANREVLRDLGAPLPVPAAGRMFFVSQIGKYLPGSVWPVLAQAELGRRYEVPRRTSLAASTVALLLSLVIGLVVAAVSLPVAAPDAAAEYWWALVAAVPLAALLVPSVLGAVADRALTAAGRPPLVRRPTARGLLRASCWQTANWVLLGLHVWVLAVAAGAGAGEALPVAVGGFALAVCAGVLFLPAPAGAGVRDAVVVLTLGVVLDVGTALAVSIVSRALLAACDVALALTWGGLHMRSRGALGAPGRGGTA